MTLALGYTAEIFEPLVFCGLHTVSKQLQPAGRSFHDTHEKPALLKKASKKVAAKEESSSESELEETKSKKKGKSQTASFKLEAILQGQDLYGLLDCSETSTMEQLKQSYRKKVLEHHPDKLSEAERKKGDKHFIRIQGAYDILSDAVRRRQYDSTLPFNEAVPTTLEAGEDFYAKFSAAFELNARWSSKRPVPVLGDESTSYDLVTRFYDFWFSFSSTRDFAHHDEHDSTQASCREEKRWMERQNSKTRTKLATAENARILKLVEAAFKFDPRVIKKKAEEAAAIWEAKNGAKERKLQAEKEAKEAAERAKLEALQKEEAEKNRKTEEKQNIKRCRGPIKALLRPHFDAKQLHEEGVAAFLISLTVLSEIEGLLNDLKNASEAGAETLPIFEAFLNSKGPAKGIVLEDAKKKETNANLNTDTWTQSELALFQKGLQKFPVGVPKRWEAIAAFVGTRSLEEVVAMSKRFAEDKGIQNLARTTKVTVAAAPVVDEWTDEQQRALEAALRKFPPSTTNQDRWELVAAEVPNKDKQQCVNRFRYLKELMTQKK